MECARKRLTPAQKLRLCFAQEYKCFNCHELLPPTVQIDHHIPLHLGGTNDWNNLVALCPLCHADKTQLEAIDRAEKHRQAKQRKREVSPYFETPAAYPTNFTIPMYVLKRMKSDDFLS